MGEPTDVSETPSENGITGLFYTLYTLSKQVVSLFKTNKRSP